MWKYELNVKRTAAPRFSGRKKQAIFSAEKYVLNDFKMKVKLNKFDQVIQQFLPMLSDMKSYTIYFLNRSQIRYK